MSDPVADAAGIDAVWSALGRVLVIVRPEDEQWFAEAVAARDDLPPITLKTSPLVEPGKAVVFGRDALGMEGIGL
jgi:hypothetical protein